MEHIIRRKYRFDCALILFCIIFSWIVLLFVLETVYALAQIAMIKAVSILSCLIVGVFLTSSLIAVLVHLRENTVGIYQEDIINQGKLQKTDRTC